MFPSFFTKTFLISTFIIIFFIIPLSNAKNANYTTCSYHYSCGKVQNIGYPFWGDDVPVFCGRSDFSFQCLKGNDYPCMYIGTKTNAKVISINISTHKMVFVSEQFLNQDPPSCLSPELDKSLNYLSKTGEFKLSSKVKNLTLFYGCPSPVPQYEFKSFPCNYTNNTRGAVFYFGERSDVTGRYTKLCEGNYSVPVLKKELDELDKVNGTILSVLKKGFEMEYIVNFTACSKCARSGGRCGSPGKDSDDFVCYCRNGPQPLECTKSGSTKLLIELSVAPIVVIGILTSLLIFLKKRKLLEQPICFCIEEMRKNEKVETFLKSYGSISPKRYTYTDIRRMTSNFKDKLGEGGFGSVFKGQLSDGRNVAVKLLTKSIGKSTRDGEEFMNEVASIGRTNHVNIVSLLGFCYQGQKKALIYEFMPNGSLEKFVFSGSNGELLSYKTLFDICIGIARGLDYLHRGCTTRILHFDIKPHNILLDEEFHPKISDFGLAKLCPQKESIISMLEARGTIGYIAPEICCRSLGGASHKSDVYSYGMMVLEMVGARKNIRVDDQNSNGSYFPRWINDALELTLDDSKHDGIMSNEEKELKRKLVVVSLWCIQTNPMSRPSMNRVVEMLEGNLDLLQMPSMPSLCSPPRSILSSEMHYNSDLKFDSTEYSMSFTRSN